MSGSLEWDSLGESQRISKESTEPPEWNLFGNKDELYSCLSYRSGYSLLQLYLTLMSRSSERLLTASLACTLATEPFLPINTASLGGSVHCRLFYHFSNFLHQLFGCPKTLEQKSQKIIAVTLWSHYFNISPRKHLQVLKLLGGGTQSYNSIFFKKLASEISD